MRSNVKAVLLCALVASLAACDQTVDVNGSSGSTPSTGSSGGTSSTSASGNTSSTSSSTASGSSTGSSGSSGATGSGSSGATASTSVSSSSSGGTRSGSSGFSGSSGGAFDSGTGDWRIVSSGDHGEITGIWGDAPGDFWACSRQGGLLRFDGTEWVLTSTRGPIRGTRQTGFTHIQGSGPDDIWVQGDFEGVMGHFDGASWTFSTVDGASGTPGSGLGLSGEAMWVRGKNDVWVSGHDYDTGTTSTQRVFHFDGSSWTAVSSPNVNNLSLLGGTSDPNGELWLAGGTNSGQTVVGGAWRYTGSFTPAFEDLTTFVPAQLWVFGGRDAWFGNARELQHWDGSQLTADSPTPTTGQLLVVSLWGTGSTLWAVGSGAYRHENGGWQQLPTYLSSGTQLTTVWGSSESDVWSCGSDGTYGQCAHFDGTAWKPASLGTWSSRSAIFVASDDTVWSADMATGVVRLQNGAWTIQPALPEGFGAARVDAMWGDSSSEVWAVTGNELDGSGGSGAEGGILRFDGSSWTQERARTGYEELLDVWGSGADDVWAVGAISVVNDGYDPLLVHRDASGWSDVSLSGQGELDAVLGFSSSDVWAVGSNGTSSRIVHNAGTGWRDWPNVPAGLTLRTLGGASASDVWAGGDGATLMHFDGSAWSTVSVPFTDDITALAVAEGTLHLATLDSTGEVVQLWSYDGSSWTQDGSFPWRVNRMVTQGSRIWAVGRNGLIARLH